MDKFVDHLEKVIYPLNKWAQKTAIVILFLIMVLTFSDVTGRFFSNPIHGTYELTGVGLALLVFFSLGYTQLKKGHVTVDMIMDKCPPRVQAVIDTLLYFIFLILVILTSWQLVENALRLYKGNDVTVDLGLPVYIFSLLASFGVLLFALTILLDFLKSLSKVMKRHDT
jgi:TRAP-type C4-dicarboxylate transport system permease small subunit